MNKSNTQRDNSLHGNVRPYIQFEMWFATLSFVIPVLVLQYRECGLSMSEVTMLQAAFAVFLAVCQVPTGFFADRHGRRLSILVGCGFLFSAEVYYAFTTTFAGFLLAEAGMAIGISFMSGADTALLSDSLLMANADSNAFARVRGRAIARLQVAAAACAAGSGFLAAALGFRVVFLLAACGVLGMFYYAFQFTEVRIPSAHKAQTVRSFWKLVLTELWGKQYVRWIVGFGAVIHAFNQPSLWFYQQYFELTGISVQATGLMFAGFNLWASLWTRLAPRAAERIGGERTMIALVWVQGLAYLTLGAVLAPLGAGLFLAHQTVRGVLGIVQSTLLNAHLGSETKATVNSASSLVSLLLYMAVLLPMGKIADMEGIQASFTSAGAAVIVAGSLTYLAKR